jgi:quinol-cytochrome oxidoreductase complex cytochrome b subunit
MDQDRHPMPKRLRKLVGTIVLLLFVIAYALVAMAIAEGRIQAAPFAIQVVLYIVLGLAWVLPVMPLIRWMEKPDRA